MIKYESYIVNTFLKFCYKLKADTFFNLLFHAQLKLTLSVLRCDKVSFSHTRLMLAPFCPLTNIGNGFIRIYKGLNGDQLLTIH